MKHSKHALHYVDLYPAPVDRDPPAWVIWLGAACALAAVYLVTVVLFTL